jgi:hypothetical protein
MLHLTNTGATTLQEGTRFAWSTLGTPAPRGEVRRLPRALEPGASIDVRPAVPASGGGCSAAAYE